MTSTAELDQKQITYTLQHHDGPAHTAAEAAAVLGVTVEQIVKTLLLMGKHTGPIIVLATGNQRLDLATVQTQLDDPSLHLATPDQVLAITGYPVGLVTPLGLKTPHLSIYATAQVTQLQSCVISSGQLGTEIQLLTHDLIQAIGGRMFEC